MSLLLVGFAGRGHAGPLLSDALILATVTRWRTLALLSVPRDLLVLAPAGLGANMDFIKLNAVLARARMQFGWSQALRALESTVAVVTGIRVSGSIATDFDGFMHLIEGLGGVDLDVPNSFVARYPTAEGGWSDVLFQSGPRHLDASQALAFVRARQTSLPGLGDFVRARHQRALLRALADTHDVRPLLIGALRARRHVHMTISFIQLFRFFLAVRSRERTRDLSLSECTELLPLEDPALGAFLAPRHGSYGEARLAVRRILDEDCGDEPSSA